MKIWLYRVWFDLDNNEISPVEEEGTVIKIQEQGKSHFTKNPELFNDIKNVNCYHVELSLPSKCEVFIHSKFINTEKPDYMHVPGDIENMSSKGTDYYYMGFTYSEDQPLSDVNTRKKECMSMCNENIIKELEKRKSEIQSSIERLKYLN